MIAKATTAKREISGISEAEGFYYMGDIRQELPALIAEYAGKAQCVYIDPPFASGQTYRMKVCAGEEDWRKGAGTLTEEAYTDPSDADSAQALLRALIEGAKALLTDTGLVFVHVDWRLSGRARCLLDEIFGEDHILNEIIWAYQTGGRARKYFSRKHDTIFMYRKGQEYFFDIGPVAIHKEGGRKNHMRRQVDADGRVYRTIRSAGKLYTYYDDEPPHPGDVWDDLNMQQKDPQRTGYETQKPLRLLERIVLCSTRKGDLVADLCAGSGTTLEAAWRLGRTYLGVDKSPMALLTVRRRMHESAMQIASPAQEEPCMQLEARIIAREISTMEVCLTALTAPETQGVRGLDQVDSWAVGYIRGETFVRYASQQRSKSHPCLENSLPMPVLEGTPAIRIADIFGCTSYFALDRNQMEYNI